VDRCMGIGFAHYYYTEHIYGLTITTWWHVDSPNI
jgi:hypothetical protein